ELAGLPKLKVPQRIDGLSLVPVMRQPETSVKNYVLHAFPRRPKIGNAIRTERYRLVEWKAPGAPAETAELELYDYKTDPGETKNLASEKPEVVKQLRAMLANHPQPKPQIGDKP